MIAGIVLIGLGYAVMSGGGSEDPAVFSDEIFNTRRLTVAPIMILAGLVLEVFAILHRPKED